MVALKKYDRIEAVGLWKPDLESQRRDVVVVLGDATITIKTTADQALAHWSIAALIRANPGKYPARFFPDGDPGEELELPETEAEMIEALDTLRRALDRARPHPGRLRWLGITASLAAVLYAALVWLPDALVEHTLRAVPKAARDDIGQALIAHMTDVTGPACATSTNTSSLSALSTRLETRGLAILRDGLASTVHVPGAHILVARELVEDHEAPDVVAGFILAEQLRAERQDPLHRLLEHAGLYATFRLLTTGRMDPESLDAYAQDVLIQPPAPLPADALLTRFADVKVPSSPYAYALDVTGETVLALIEGDPAAAGELAPVLSDRDWVQLQAICDAP